VEVAGAAWVEVAVANTKIVGKMVRAVLRLLLVFDGRDGCWKRL